MRYDPEQDWRDKIANIQRLARNFRPRDEARRFVPTILTDEARERVESVTRFEQFKGRILKQNGSTARVTNR